MDKNAIKKFAIRARRELITRVSTRAAMFGVTEEGYGEERAISVGDRVLSAEEIGQRAALVEQVKSKGYKQVMEEAAYTWFNRFIALRYMEVNDYIPGHIRVFTDEENKFKPQILDAALDLDLDGVNVDETIMALKTANDDEGLFKFLIINQCNALSESMPGMFQRIDDYTELLFPDNLLREGSAIDQMIAAIPEDDWRDQVQIIGWLYQYYNSEKKDEVFAALKKNIKVTKESLPAATQLFTPDWIVRYMVENSLGRLFINGQLSEDSGRLSESERSARERALAEKMGWKYYLPEAEQEPQVRAELNRLSGGFSLEELRLIDPCAGSGHILAYMFDVLMQIYLEYGYTTRDAVRRIVKDNLYGLDIDDRAAQLAYFSVMMKACEYDRRFLGRGIEPRVYPIIDSASLDSGALEHFAGCDARLKAALGSLIEDLSDAKEYGSILTVRPVDFAALYEREGAAYDELSLYDDYADVRRIMTFIQSAELLAQKYDIVCTNPPYMGGSNMDAKLSEYVKKHYPDSKSDLFACFIERGGALLLSNGYQTMVTQHAWMFLSSFEKLRVKLLMKDTVSMAHLGPRAFEEIGGEVVQTTSFVLRNSHIADYKGTYCRLIEPTTQQGKEEMFLAGENRYTAQQSNFSKIPGSPVAYWWRDNIYNLFSISLLSEFAQPKVGLQTGNNEKYLRFWSEVKNNKISFGCKDSQQAENSKAKWFPCNKGGEFRRWYGNNIYVVDWESNGSRIRRQKGSYIRNPMYYFREGMTWSTISSSKLSMRYSPTGFLFETKGSVCFPNNNADLNYLLGLFNTNVVQLLLTALSPTLDYHEGPLGKVPTIFEDGKREVANKIVNCAIAISKTDWDSYETSWDFQRHPMV